MPDSDATTVPAATPEAKRMAAEGVAAFREDLKKKPDPDPQPKALVKKNRLTSAAMIKASESSEQLEDKTAKPLHPKTSPTAVKAKAAPKTEQKQETPDTEEKQKAQAIAECLARSSTQDMLHASQTSSPAQNTNAPPAPEQKAKDKDQAKPKETETKLNKKETKPKEKEAKPTEKEASPKEKEAESDEDSSEEARKAEQVRLKKEAHARYMRFHRSLSSTLATSF